MGCSWLRPEPCYSNSKCGNLSGPMRLDSSLLYRCAVLPPQEHAQQQRLEQRDTLLALPHEPLWIGPLGRLPSGAFCSCRCCCCWRGCWRGQWTQRSSGSGRRCGRWQQQRAADGGRGWQRRGCVWHVQVRGAVPVCGNIAETRQEQLAPVQVRLGLVAVDDSCLWSWRGGGIAYYDKSRRPETGLCCLAFLHCACALLRPGFCAAVPP
jgi:hypothetical protein